jgi:hypothetical protein
MPKKTLKAKKSSKKTKTTAKAPKKTKKTKKAAPAVVAPPAVVPAAPAVPAVPVAAPAPVKSEAEKIWSEIKDLPIDMFGLPNQFVSMHCTFVTVEPSQLYVTIRSSATLPSLEAAVAPHFVVELADKFVIVKRVPKLLK